VERTLIIIKPDAVQRGLVGEIIRRFENLGLRIAGMKLMQVSRELASRHYGEHEGKPFYESLLSYISSAPVVVMALEGPNAIALARKTIGETKPVDSPPGSIRGDFGVDVGRNLIHGSDGAASAQREIDLFFGPDELLRWSRDMDRWIFEA
jgi:nucleoside-diphosphate kinase